MHKYVYFLCFLISVTKAFATTYVPIPIKKQLSESSGVVKGEVVNLTYDESEDGQIVTKVFMRADKWIGIQPENNHLEVVFPGGQIGDRVQTIHGAPSFKIGEKVVVLLNESKQNQGSSNFWLHNLALGKFMIKRYGKAQVLINSAFPHNPQVGQIPLKSFYELASRIKKKKFKERFKDKYEIQNIKQVYQANIKNSRSIASVESHEENTISTGWLLAVLGILGGLVTMIRRKDNHS